MLFVAVSLLLGALGKHISDPPAAFSLEHEQSTRWLAVFNHRKRREEHADSLSPLLMTSFRLETPSVAHHSLRQLPSDVAVVVCETRTCEAAAIGLRQSLSKQGSDASKALRHFGEDRPVVRAGWPDQHKLNTGRKLLQRLGKPQSPGPLNVVKTLKVDEHFWRRKAHGQGVKVAIFDTGIARSHRQFARANLATCVDYTGAPSCEDGFGHGSFVAGLLVSQEDCVGMAPDAELHVFKVFTDKQASYTSWFLDAFNHAISLEVDVLNLSIGGPDYMDKPFMDKVLEVSANGITIVSAIGNDGPLYGTLNNPADQIDVLGVGGITQSRRVASFSSRGMTTWELPQGYGRIKPDVLTYGEMVRSTSHRGGCKTLSGTSVASPVVTGVVTEIICLCRMHNFSVNPAFVKQVLTDTARPLADTSVYEQGSGVISVGDVVEHLEAYFSLTKEKAPSFLPQHLPLHDCERFWPHCKHPLFLSSRPVVVNVTILNPVSLRGRLMSTSWTIDPQLNLETGYDLEFYQSLLVVEVEYSRDIWPWTGWLALSLSVSSAAADKLAHFSGIVSGALTAVILAAGMNYSIVLDVDVRVIPTPPRHRRILWDIYHNLQYPPAYIARDDLLVTSDILDWNGDHPHTNYRDAFNHIVEHGYYVELLTDDFTAFNASLYGMLFLVDTEEEFSTAEKAKLADDISKRGLAVVVFADWYNVDLMSKARFLDDNTKEVWTPVVGGANLPALNDLLAPFNVAFGDSVYAGLAKISNDLTVRYASGSHVARFPAKGTLVSAAASSKLSRLVVKKGNKHTNERSQWTQQQQPVTQGIAVLGLTSWSGPRVAAYGDSSCLDSAHSNNVFCFGLLDAILQWGSNGEVASSLKGPDTVVLTSSWTDSSTLPVRSSLDIMQHSHVLHGGSDRRDPHHNPLLVAGTRVKPVKPVDWNETMGLPEQKHHPQKKEVLLKESPPRSEERLAEFDYRPFRPKMTKASPRQPRREDTDEVVTVPPYRDSYWYHGRWVVVLGSFLFLSILRRRNVRFKKKSATGSEPVRATEYASARQGPCAMTVKERVLSTNAALLLA
ncbi:Subtilisin-like protease SBT6.1 [Diplonema papillatum]|nr:Subtilisin-like protease SBT6.1 [Diplonema papillatum]